MSASRVVMEDDFVKEVADKIATLTEAASHSISIDKMFGSDYELESDTENLIIIGYKMLLGGVEDKNSVEIIFQGGVHDKIIVTRDVFDTFDFSKVVNWLCEEN